MLKCGHWMKQYVNNIKIVYYMIIQRNEDIKTTERNIISKTKETTADIIKHVKQTGQEIKDKIDDLIVDIKQDHSIARIQSHRDDETFVHTMALNKGTNILKEENLLVLLAKGGSGKTQIALHLASAYNDEGYIPLFFSGKDVIKYQDLISLKYKNIVIVEDLFVYTALKYNFFDENLIGCRIENDQLFKRIFSTFDEKEPKIRKTLVQQAIRKLEGRYLIHSSRYSDFYHDVCSYSLGKAYMFKHQAVHDAVLVAFGSHNPDILLSLDICSLDFISQYIRPSLKQPDRNFSVIHVDPKLVIDKLLHFIEIEISTKNGRIVGFSHPWFPKPVNGQDDEEDSQEQTRSDEGDRSEPFEYADFKRLLDLQTEKNDSYQSSDDLQTEETDIDQSSDDVPNCIDLEEEDPDSEKETDLSRFAFRCIRGYSEMAGEYIRKCIIEKRYASFVKTFLERLSTLSPPPDEMKDFLNGLTRRGTCLMNLMINSDIVRNSALKYAEYNVFCLIFRPKSLTVNHYKFYQLDDETLQEKLISIINENKNYKIIAEIGNFLYRIGVEEGNFIFVERFLDSILERYWHLVDHYKIRYIIDGMSAKGRRKEVVSRFKEFMQTNLLTFGSIKTIIGLWEVIKTEINKNDENNTPLMSILERKFEDHLLYGLDFEEGVNYKVQTQEYGTWVYNLSMEIQDNKFIEELLTNLNDIYETRYWMFTCMRICKYCSLFSLFL
ncbi:Hypothetical predicted protein [Mytilus galloprovincialis]|uniref:Novel STAND NTPase 3 domain-containing protein n=1 Tax=Mytilus galloprovincialis TaxID=29158 RepID=A0A8B6EF86_MYTGA|nr:Hypothetical predicted protein [Mytilus galloprovincialis]